MRKVIFWDFDGTLAYRPKMFSSSLVMVLDAHGEGRQIAAESFEPWLKSGFPWQEPEKDYRSLKEPGAWWENLYPVFEKAYVMNGVLPEKAKIYAREVRRYLIAPGQYPLYDDTVDALKRSHGEGFSNVILSNHIPELPDIVKCLRLAEDIDDCLSSANLGYEKPNPKIFQLALEKTGNPESAWMIGDSLKADIRGAEAAGMKAILVRKPAGEPVRYFSSELKGIFSFIHSDGRV